MYSLYSSYFNLNQIFNSHQLFRWNKFNKNKYLIYNSDKFLAIEQIGQRFVFNCDSKNFEYWFNYFDLKFPYDIINNKFKCLNKKIKSIANYSEGIHILNIDLWESIVFSVLKNKNQIECLSEIGNVHYNNITNLGKHKWNEIPTYEIILDNKKYLKFIGPGKDVLFYICELIKNKELNLEYLKTLNVKEVNNYLLDLAFPSNVIKKICINGLGLKSPFPLDLKLEDKYINKIKEYSKEDKMIKDNLGLLYYYLKYDMKNSTKKKEDIKNGYY